MFTFVWHGVYSLSASAISKLLACLLLTIRVPLVRGLEPHQWKSLESWCACVFYYKPEEHLWSKFLINGSSMAYQGHSSLRSPTALLMDFTDKDDKDDTDSVGFLSPTKWKQIYLPRQKYSLDSSVSEWKLVSKSKILLLIIRRISPKISFKISADTTIHWTSHFQRVLQYILTEWTFIPW